MMEEESDYNSYYKGLKASGVDDAQLKAYDRVMINIADVNPSFSLRDNIDMEYMFWVDWIGKNKWYLKRIQRQRMFGINKITFGEWYIAQKEWYSTMHSQQYSNQIQDAFKALEDGRNNSII